MKNERKWISLVKGSWLVVGLVLVIVLRTTPEDQAAQAILIGVMALLHGFYVEYRLDQLRDSLEYK